MQRVGRLVERADLVLPLGGLSMSLVFFLEGSCEPGLCEVTAVFEKPARSSLFWLLKIQCFSSKIAYLLLKISNTPMFNRRLV